MNSLYPDKAFYMFDRLVEQAGCLYKIETPQPEKIYKRLDRYKDYSGRAFYYWKNGQGLYRTDIPNIFAPNTEKLCNALQHISLSIHFGIYLFTDIGTELHAPMTIKIISQLLKQVSEQKKLLIFAGQDLDIPPQLDKHFIGIQHKVHSATQNTISSTSARLAS